jgi:DNA excision repair protein ERCC-4
MSKLPMAPEGWQPTIVVDTREQTPLRFTFPTIAGTLPTADYSVAGLEEDFAVERKSLPDLFGSLTSGRDRFRRELQRLLAYPFRRLLVIGSEAEITQGMSRARGVNPKAVLHSLYAIEARGVPVVFARDPGTAADLVERWAFWRAREVLKKSSALLTLPRNQSDS